VGTGGYWWVLVVAGGCWPEPLTPPLHVRDGAGRAPGDLINLINFADEIVLS